MDTKTYQLVFNVAILLQLVSQASGSLGTGPYVLANLHLLPCEDQGTNELKFNIQMYRTQDKTKRTFAHRGEITIPSNTDEGYKIVMMVYKWGTDWILVTDYNDEYCKALSLEPHFFRSLCGALGVNSTCPMTPGRHVFEDWNVDFHPVPPVLPYGKYKSTIQFKNAKNEVIGCMSALSDIEKKFS